MGSSDVLAEMRWPLAALVSIALVSGCSNGEATPSIELTASGQASHSRPAQPAIDPRCRAFALNFAELVACKRANGTLGSFGNPKVAWRVRYFVRHWAMPCDEDPTEHEGYVYHMVTNDLYDDPDLNDTQRVDIRNAMFDGRAHCM
jgi:hypothetical protein